MHWLPNAVGELRQYVDRCGTSCYVCLEQPVLCRSERGEGRKMKARKMTRTEAVHVLLSRSATPQLICALLLSLDCR